MTDTPQKLIGLNKAILELAEKPGFQNAQKTINAVISLLKIDATDQWKLFSDSNGKIRSNAGWFMLAEGFADRRAAYKIVDDNKNSVDLKAYWMKNISKQVTSWLVALTPNFEDEPFFKSKNIGIDFIIPEKADRIIVVLSNNYVIRTLELSERLSLTQKEIFVKWLQNFNFENKAQVHENLWQSFDLESVNKTFYKEISSFFVELKQHLADKKIFDERHAALFANRLIGRVIFCWFLDKKGFINPKQNYFDLEDGNATEYYQLKLEKLFFRTLNKKIKDRGEDVYNLVGGIDEETPFLNGGLFTPKEDDYFGVKHITFPADYFDRLYSFLKHYNFTTDESTSSFQQVAIDPEMLGRIFENLLAEQVEETGEQARKAKGAFYTPREIVEYMCKESLREYLKSKIEKSDESDQRIGQLLDSKPHEWRDQQRNYREKLKKYKYEILEALDDIKVIDPACGSGAFPMGMLQLLLQTYERLDPTFDPYKKKLKIIKDNLFGIDIEPMAVEIARLRSWLSIIVDEELNPKAENMGIHPLPNLEFKFVCANSLIPAPVEEENGLFEDPFFEELEQKAKEFFEITDAEKKEAKKNELHELTDRKVKEKLDNAGQLSIGLNMGKFEGELKKKNKKAIDENLKLFYLWSSYTNIFTTDEPVGFFETKYFFPSAKEGFDVVIGNPPYVSTKGRDGNDKATLKNIYGFADDLYSHFYFKGIEMAKNDTGVLAYITSKTFWTIQTKKNVRELLQSNKIIEVFDTAAPFSAMVDTCVVIVKKNETDEDYLLHFNDGKNNLVHPENYTTKISLYRNAVNQVFFIPNKFNLQIYNKYNHKVSDLMRKWWSKIDTSKNISQNKEELKIYRNSLKVGDVALLGTLTEGGQGLATANNGKYIGVREGTKQAEAVRNSRPKKLLEVNKRIKKAEFNNDPLVGKSELEIRKLFDDLKEKYGRDIFGQGYLFRIVSEDEIADVNKIKDEEKKKGIEKSKPHFVPYDKGDKDGNRWWLETPFVIDWSKDSVQFLKNNSGKKGKGMPVFRNPQFYFREGFCWSDIHTVLIKSRLKSHGVYDVKSMSMFSASAELPDWFFVALLNSTFISNYDFNFVNSTSSFQINDARQIPIVIPSKKQLDEFKKIFNEAYIVKQKQFSFEIQKEEAKEKLNKLQKKMDMLVYELYGLVLEEIKIVDNS